MSPANTPRARPGRHGSADGRARKPGADGNAAPEGQSCRRGQLAPGAVHRKLRLSAGRHAVEFLSMRYRPGHWSRLLDGRSLRMGLHPRHRATARLSQTRARKRRYRDGHDVGAVAAIAGAERLSDAVGFPGAPHSFVALHRQLVLDRATQRPPGGRGAALDRSQVMPRARSQSRRPGIQRDLLRDRRQSADQHDIFGGPFAGSAGARRAAYQARHQAQPADRRDLVVGIGARGCNALGHLQRIGDVLQQHEPAVRRADDRSADQAARRRAITQPMERAGQGHECRRRADPHAWVEVSANLDFQRGRADRRTAEDDRPENRLGVRRARHPARHHRHRHAERPPRR